MSWGCLDMKKEEEVLDGTIIKNKDRDVLNRLVNIVILDTGSSLNHPFFKDINCELLSVEGIRNPIDECGHGTFVLSVLVGTMRKFSNVKYKITSIKVSENSSIDINILIKGLQYCNKINPDVVYIGSCNCAYSDVMARILSILAHKGVIIVVPSGNYPFYEPTYPSCLETTFCCGLANEDGSICNNFNTYGADVFIKCRNVLGVLSEQNAQLFGATLNNEGMAFLSATSFSAAEFAAYVSVLKAYRADINVYSLRELIHKNYEKLVLFDFNLLLADVRKKNGQFSESPHKNYRYIMLHPSKDMSVACDWTFHIYTVDGRLEKCFGTLILELYQDKFMTNKLYQDEIEFKNGRGVISLTNRKLKPGIYMIKLGNRENGIESVISMMISRPEKPKVVIKDNNVYVDPIFEGAKILYTEKGIMPMARAGGEVIAPTKIYSGPIRRSKEIMVFCTYCNDIFSEPVILES